MSQIEFLYGNRNVDRNQRLVTSINVDNRKHTIVFVIEKGLEVDAIELTIEACQEAGLLNLDVLNKIYNK